jgi:hypothetical protein
MNWQTRNYPENPHVLGTVNLQGKEAGYSVGGALPSRPGGMPWELAFSCAKRGDDKIKVYLRNDNHETLDFYKGSDSGYLNLKPGESGLIFEGDLDALALAGRKEESELVFKSTTPEELKFSIQFVPEDRDVGEITPFAHYLRTGYSLPRWVVPSVVVIPWLDLLFWRAKRRKRAAL